MYRLNPLMALLFTLSLSLALHCVPAHAEGSKSEDIMKMLMVSGQLEASQQIISVMTPQLVQLITQSNPQLPQDKLKELMSHIELELKKEIPQLLKSLVPVYDKHFTHEEIKGLITFYTSPVGKRFVEKQTLVIPESMKVGELWGQQVAQKALKSALSKIEK